MSLFEIIGSVLIGPLKLLFEVIFVIAYDIIRSPGLSIIVLSLTMNILVLPLYRRADAIQIEARDTENRLKDVVAHIKKTFSGDERMMILQTYYRQNNYNPLSVLSGSISLLLEIPFFMAAYQFLSGVGLFAGATFGPIRDLSVPDGLIVIGSVSINALPIIMTLVNVISSSLYLKGFPLKTKIQLYGMALFFLVFLYNSPAALVFYWTLNNTFSLLKTLFYRIKNSRTILNILLSLAGFALVLLKSPRGRPLLITIGLIAQLPWLLPILRAKLSGLSTGSKPAGKPNKALFVLGALFLTVLTGLLIPSTYIAASPQEYIDVYYFYDPVWYVVHTLCLSAGTFLVWMGVFYWLANPAGKRIFFRVVWALCGIMLVNYMFFGTKLGVLSPDLVYTTGLTFSNSEIWINIGVIVVLALALYLLSRKFARGFTSILLVGAIALASMSVVNIVKIAKKSEETKVQIQNSSDRLPSFSLSKNGNNVVVIMLDTAIGPFVPYLLEENPALLEKFDGFTYYFNTLSYGGHTNFGTPPLYGGYEYTPVNMNLRDTELLEDKHNEALKVMPIIFSEAGYDVTLIDPPYAGYQWIPDLSVFDDISGVDAYHADGRFNDMESRIKTVTARTRNFFLFSLMKTFPVALQASLYNDGTYRAVSAYSTTTDTTGVAPTFMNAYNVVKNMTTMTNISSGSENTYMFLRSNVTHDAAVLQEPTYEPSSNVDNSLFYPAKGKTITANGSFVLLDQEHLVARYHINMAALIQLGNWFDYLRENGVYDNTRIIVVADHGFEMDLFHTDFSDEHSMEYYMPMMLVKDFNAKGFTTSDEFMTNADVPTLSTEGLIQNPVNPFTGNAITSDSKTNGHPQYVILSHDWNVEYNNGYQFFKSQWASVTGDIHRKENWTFYSEKTTLPPNLQK